LEEKKVKNKEDPSLNNWIVRVTFPTETVKVENEDG